MFCLPTQTGTVQGDTEQAVETSYRCMLLGWQHGQLKLLAASAADVGSAGQQYIDMLAQVNARLVRSGYGQVVSQVSLLGTLRFVINTRMDFEWLYQLI